MMKTNMVYIRLVNRRKVASHALENHDCWMIKVATKNFDS